MSMHNTMTHLSVIVSHHPSWGYFAAFFLSFLESLAVVGSIIPGAITMTAVGVMIGSGILGPWLAFFLAIIGALTGDTLSFYLGITYQDKLLRIWPLSRHPEWFEKGQRFFTKYGIAALIIGRFFGPMRSMVPLIAGVLQMQSRNFAMGIIPSAIIWAIVYLMPGILLGALSTSFPSEIAIEILVDGTLMIIAFWALWELINLCYHGISRRLVQIASRFVRLLKRHTWGSNLHQHLEDPLDPQALHQSYALLLAFFASIIFIMTAISSHHQGIITLLDKPLHTFFISLQSPWSLHWVGVMAVLGHHTTIGLFALLLITLFLYQKHYWRAYHILMLAGLTDLLIHFTKQWVHHTRPEGLTELSHSFAFPSGHAAGTTAIVIFLCMLLKGHPKQHFIHIFGWLLIAAMALSRLILGVHWPSDILGGCLLGLAIAKCLIISYQRRQRAVIHPERLLKRIVALFSLCAAIMIPIEFHSLNLPPKTPNVVQVIAKDQWWERTQTSAIDVFRDNRFGVPSSPFNVQVHGDLSQLQERLTLLGWVNYPAATSLRSMIIRHKNPKHHFPLMNLLYHNHPPALIMVHPDETPVILRIWQSQLTLENGGPIWLGTVNCIRPDFHRFMPHWRYTRWKDFHDGIDRLRTIILQSRSAIITKPATAVAAETHWNNRVLLLDLNAPPSPAIPVTAPAVHVPAASKP